MEKIKVSEVLSLFNENICGFDELPQIENVCGSSIYSKLLKAVIELDISDAQAKEDWWNILNKRRKLTEKLGRRVSIPVAILDYYSSENKQINKPKILEVAYYKKIHSQAIVDELTSVYNRRYFNFELSREFNLCKRHHNFFSICLIDLDSFKGINDTFGHMMGDKVLTRFGAILQEECRIEDTICRLGGDEFAIIMPQTTEKNGRLAMHRIITASKCTGIPEVPEISFSYGLAQFPEHAADMDSLIASADQRLYAQKREDD